jgi:hypothetical protein
MNESGLGGGMLCFDAAMAAMVSYNWIYLSRLILMKLHTHLIFLVSFHEKMRPISSLQDHGNAVALHIVVVVVMKF